MTTILVLVLGMLGPVSSVARAEPPRLIAHEVKLDALGQIEPWAPYDTVVRLAWGQLNRFPIEANGLPSFFTFPRFDGAPGGSLKGIWWAHNPAGMTAMFVDGALSYYAYSGDDSGLRLARALADHQLEHGTTPADWSWASVPFASANPDSLEWGGGDDRQFCGGGNACGRGDGVGFLEPDKIGELGAAYLALYEHYGDERYARAAVRCGDALVAHARVGDATHSPWPFRVDGRTGLVVREPYSANTIGPIRLYDELVRLGLGRVEDYRVSRAAAWAWLLAYPLRNHHWQGYFEDIPIHLSPDENPNQYSPLETVKYLLGHQELDPDWKFHVRDTLDWVARTFAVDYHGRFGLEAGRQWGAEVISEQHDDMAKMGSHTARFASVLALLAADNGDPLLKERARRALNWATYACDERGVVKVGTNDDEGYWFSDGYADYMRHFQLALAAQPEWAPAHEDHLLRTSSVLRRISYFGGTIEYETFDAFATETLRLRREPWGILLAGHALKRVAALDAAEGYTLQRLSGGDVVVRLHRTTPGRVTILGR